MGDLKLQKQDSRSESKKIGGRAWTSDVTWNN